MFDGLCGAFGSGFQMHYWNGFFVFVIIIGVITAGIIFTVRGLRRSDPVHTGSGNRISGSPSEIAKKRYASGEITREEFQKIISNIDPGTNG
ncbi:MAG TPA: SHOCT domain-containing protein [Spirochaetes bacterium]|nr:SHOCT domain-containing protein [Spirochaetota bacterium]